MTDPANRVILRSDIRRAGFLNLEQLEDILNTMNAEQREQALLQGLQGIKSLTISLQQFDGAENNILDWLEDFDRYIQETKGQTNDAKLFALIHHLSSEAKQWFQLQNDNTKQNCNDLRAALKEKFHPPPTHPTREDCPQGKAIFHKAATARTFQGLCVEAAVGHSYNRTPTGRGCRNLHRWILTNTTGTFGNGYTKARDCRGTTEAASSGK